MSYRFERTETGTDIVISGWESGISDSPYATSQQTALGTVQQSGVSDMRNINIISVPGEASVGLKSQAISQTPISGAAFTAATNGTFTYSGTTVKKGSVLTLNTLTGGTISLAGVSMQGASTSIVVQGAENTSTARLLVTSNGLAGVSSLIQIGFISNPANADSVVFQVNGVTFPVTFVSVIGAAAGNVLIGATTADTIANLLGLLQNPATTSATQVAFSNAGSPSPRTIIGYFTSTSGTYNIGLSTTGNYWVSSATSSTFTLSNFSPDASGNVPTSAVFATQVPATASGTFSTAKNIALFTQIVPNSTNTVYYGIDTNGLVWAYNLAYSTNWVWLGNTASAATKPDFNTGIAVWNGYIIVIYDGPAGYHIYTALIGSIPPIFVDFKDLTNDTVPHRTFVDKNNTLYWCDGSQIGSLIELTTFDPTSSSTYTWSQAALLIQPDDVAQCMEQLGTNLIIGGIYNQNYVWDRFSTGYTPLFLPENNCHRMVTVNSNTYLFVGNRGRIYITNGANAQLYKKVPDHLSNTVEPIYVWGGAMYNKNQLYFSLTAFGSGQSSETALPYYGGIWAIDTNTNAMRVVNQLSYGTYAGYTAEMCGMIANTTTTSGIPLQNFGLICGWEDSTETASPNYGSDVLPVNSTPVVANTPYTNFESYVDSDMIPIGTYLNPKTDANVEFKLTVPMVAGEGIKFGWRQNLSQSFTDITSASRPTGVFTSADVGSGLSGVIQVNFQKSQWLQIRTYMKSTDTNPSYVRLREVRIR